MAAILSQPQYVNQCPFEVGNRNQQGVKNLGSLLKHVKHHIIISDKGLKAQTRCWGFPITLKSGRHLGSIATEAPIKFWSDQVISTTNYEAFKLHKILKQPWWSYSDQDHIYSLVQNCSNSIANALELLQSCPRPLISWLLENWQYQVLQI